MKELKDYRYKPRIQEATPTTVMIVCEEVDGNDGFGFEVSIDTLNQMKEDGTFKDFIKQKVSERLAVLERCQKEDEEKKVALTKVSIDEIEVSASDVLSDKATDEVIAKNDI